MHRSEPGVASSQDGQVPGYCWRSWRGRQKVQHLSATLNWWFASSSCESLSVPQRMQMPPM